MKILFIDDKPGFGGVSTHLNILTKELIENNYTVEIACQNLDIYKKSEEAGAVIKEFVSENLETLYTIVEEGNFDIINPHAHPRVTEPLIEKYYGKIKIVYTEHSAVTDDAALKYQAFLTRLNELSDLIITVSYAGRLGFMKAGIEAKKMYTIPNSVHVTKKKYEHSKRKNLMFAGRLSNEKNLFLLIEMMSVLKEIKPDIILDIYGDGPLLDKLSSSTRNRKLDNNIKFHGYVENIDEMYANHSMLILPSYTESCSYAILEGIANRIPIVASNVAGNREIIHHEINGYLFDPYSAEELVDIIIESIDDAKLLELISENAISKLQDYYCPEVNCKKYINLIEKIL